MRAEGTPFGSYVLLQRLARGGMAEVFLARQRGPQGFDRQVAVKRMLPHLMDSEDFVRQFHDEARLAARLSHPNIVHIYEFGKVGEHHFIAMEYVDGVHAGALIQHGARELVPASLVARIGADACAGLNHAHRLQDQDGRLLHLVHRDISPPNLMISFDGVVKLVDFGIAKAVDMMDKTRPGIVKGKFAYMSPEQTMGKKLDGRSDVFSLALVCWELLAGRVAVNRADPVEAMRCIRDGKLPSLRSVRPDVPAALVAILEQALRVRPRDRPGAMELGNLLEGYIKSSPELGTSMQLAEWVRTRFSRPGADAGERGPDASGADEARPGLPESELPRPELPRPELPRSELPRPELPRSELPRPELPRPELPRPDAPGPAVAPLVPSLVSAPDPAGAAPGALDPRVALFQHVDEDAPTQMTSIPVAPQPLPPLPHPQRGPEPLLHAAQGHGFTRFTGTLMRRRRILLVALATLLVSILVALAISADEGAVTGALDAGADHGDVRMAAGEEGEGEVEDGEPRAWLEVVTRPPGALVTLGDGEAVPSPALFDDLPPGAYVVRVALEGHHALEESVELEPGLRTLELTLEPLPARATSAKRAAKQAPAKRTRQRRGYVSAVSRPASDVYIGRRKLGTTPFADRALDAGTYTFTFKQAGYAAETRRVTIRPGKTTKLNVPLRKQ